MHKRKIKDLVLPSLVFIVVITIWQSVDYFFRIREIILPNPYEIFSESINSFSQLIFNTSITLFESIVGFFIAVVLSLVLATIFVYSKNTKNALYPYAIALKATPLYALAPLLIIWFGNGIFSKIIMASLVAFFPVLIGAVKGLDSIKEDYLDLFKSFNASKFQIFKLRLKNSLPFLFPSLKVASTLAVVGATIAEFTGSTLGIGHLIVTSSYYIDTSLMFSAILFVSLGGILLFYSIDLIEKKAVFWK